MSELIELLQKYLEIDEGKSKKPYKDSKGIWTIGIGRNLESPGLSLKEMQRFGENNFYQDKSFVSISCARNFILSPLSDEEIHYLLDNDIKRVIEELKLQYEWFLSLSIARQYVICNMYFQLGQYKFRKFKNLIKSLELKDYDLAAKEMLDSKWAKSDSPARAKRLHKIMLSNFVEGK